MNEESAIPLNLGVLIELSTPDSFLLIKETLTRLGVVATRSKTLYQSAHILHKRGFYYIVHFKSMFELDGKKSTISAEDIGRRNRIAKLLEDWGLLKILNKSPLEPMGPLSSVKVISYKDKDNWNLISKYSIGNKI